MAARGLKEAVDDYFYIVQEELRLLNSAQLSVSINAPLTFYITTKMLIAFAGNKAALTILALCRI